MEEYGECDILDRGSIVQITQLSVIQIWMSGKEVITLNIQIRGFTVCLLTDARCARQGDVGSV